ncbi:acyl transferase/acyl hydrolase/lysophospholipase, partial [Trichophaea hybrida]
LHSTDGGGVRGISSLIILKHLMASLVKESVITEQTLPCEYFDMIGGTSTGGIIAILLGRLRLSVDECIKLYESMGSEIFRKTKNFQTGTMFSASRLEHVFHRIVSERTRNESELLRYSCEDRACPIFVVSIDKEKVTRPDGATLFRSYEAPNDPFGSVSIVEAARATSAAPTYFKPIQIKTSTENKSFVDGGLGHNNPVLHLIKEAKMAYPQADIGCLISIGTGVQQGVKLAAEGAARTNIFGLPIIGRMAAKIDAAIVVAALATSSENIHCVAESMFQGTGIYYRFNVCEETNIKLFEYQKMDAMRKATENYLQQDPIAEYARKCVSQLQSSGAITKPSPHLESQQTQNDQLHL